VRGVRRGGLLSLRESTCLCNYSSDGFRRAISDAILIGDGVGKPQGLLNPIGGIPIWDTALSTPAGTFTWQDLIISRVPSFPLRDRGHGCSLAAVDGRIWDEIVSENRCFSL